MKRTISLFLILIFLFSASSCGKSVNMSELTEYQNGNFRAELKITSNGESFPVSLEKKGGRFFLAVKERAELAGFTFVRDENGISVLSDGWEIPVACEEELFYLSEVFSLFSVSVAGTWKIEKKHPGGVELYLCKNESISLYIDANSYLPLKIASEKAVADVLAFSVLSD